MNQFQISNPEASQRARIAIVGLIALFAVLTVAFFRLQVLEANTYELRSESNRLRPFPIEAARGAVFDRDGRVVASSVPGYSVHVFPSPASGVMAATLERLQSYLDLDDERIELLLERARREPYQPLLVDGDADFDLVSALEEHRAELPNVVVRMDPKRQYQAARAVSHLIGYVGEVTAEELEQERYSEYSSGMTVGKEGVERQYEARLQGKRGLRYSEVDALGRIVSSPFGQVVQAPEPGVDMQLNLDLDLMEWIHHIFPDSMRGAAVVLDAEDGGVLALYSAPTFDPNSFVGGIEPDEWASLNSDPDQPLFNRAVVGRYAPGSTWKLAVAAIGLQLGLVEAHEHMPRGCTGGMFVGNRRFGCWNEAGHGALNLVEAIQHSCNVYFYQLGAQIGLRRLLEVGNRMGFGARCGIDLPQEAGGNFPEGAGYWKRRFGYEPREGEAVVLAIGQGPNDQTPLKMAQFLLAVARDGSAPAPSLRRSAAGATEEGWSLDIPKEHLEHIREGMRRVTRQGGTAYRSSLEHFDLLGKTGTAQSGGDRPNHAWFTGMAGPYGAPPEIVVVALVEFGGSGSGVAAPLVAKTADFYLRGRHGIPRDTIQTLGEYELAGRSTAWDRRPDR